MKFLKSVKSFIGKAIPLDNLNYSYGKTYVFDNGKIVEDHKYVHDCPDDFLLKWRRLNEGNKVSMSNIDNLLKCHLYKSVILQSLFISDLYEICKKRGLDLLKINYLQDRPDGMFIEASIYEDSFDNDLYEDIINYYFDYIKNFLLIKKSQYGKLHNIKNLYKVETSNQNALSKGIFKIKICISY